MDNKEKFRQLYNKLYSENFNELENLRKQEAKPLKKILWIVAIIFICVIVFGILELLVFTNVFSSDDELGAIIGAASTVLIGGPLLVVIIFGLGLLIFKQAKKTSVVEKRGSMFEEESPEDKTYKSIFKQKIIKPMVQLALPESEYLFNKGLTQEEYASANWEKYDTYDSEDGIVTNININLNTLPLIMSEVHTEDIRRDPDGGTDHVTLFHGLAGYMELPKDIGCYIKVINNKINVFGNTKDKMEMDMPEFERIFDVQTDDEIKTMQILTADIMAEFLEIIEKNNFKFEFYINNNVMHIRFHTGELFEPAVFKESLQFEYLEKYFDIINSVKNITEHICNIIMNTEI